MLQERNRTGAADDESAHVGNIEESGRFPRGEMFLDDSGFVLDWHMPAAEFDHRRSERDMPVMQNRFVKLHHRFCPHLSSSMVP